MIGLFALVFLLAASFSSAQGTPQFQSSNANERFIRIEHSVHPLATAPYPAHVSDAGRVEDGRLIKRVLLTLSPGAGKQEALQKFLSEQQNRASENYHHWLTPAEYGSKFGVETTNVQQARAWLEQSGFTVDAIAKSGRWIEFAGTARQVNEAFHTELHYFEISGKRYVGNATDISLPEALAQISGGLVSLNSFPKHSAKPLPSGVAGAHEKGQKAKLAPNLTATGPPDAYFVTPGDFAVIYNTKPLLNSGNDGTGVAIAVTGQSQIELSDVQSFRQVFKLKANDPNIILSGPDPGVTSPIDQQEATLDVEWAGAVAPGATINLVIAGSTDATNGVDLAAAYAIDNQIAPILTYTYGDCEQALGASGNAFYSSLWQQAAAEGITVVVAAGDSGSAGCDASNSVSPAAGGLAVNGAASTPYNLAVGGTEFAEGAAPSTYWNATNDSSSTSALGYIPEAAWNESCDPGMLTGPTNCVFSNANFSLLASGGGASTIYLKPSWQTGTGVPADGARDVPDVALAASFNHDGIVYCNSLGGKACEVDDQQNISGLAIVGGTSASTPAMAGILALVEQKNGAFQGQVNGTLYNLAQHNSCISATQTNPTAQNSCMFYDVNIGNNVVPCAGSSPGCSSTRANINGLMTGQNAGVGYDLATGLGSINATNLVNGWKDVTYIPSETQLQVPTASVVHGTPIAVTGAVTPGSGTGTPTGSITFKTGTYGNADLVSLASGVFSATVSDLPGGQYALVAHYGGDGTFAASDSNSVAVSITAEQSTTSLTAQGLTGSPVPYGNPVELIAKAQGVSGMGIATGSVTLQDGTAAVGTYALSADGEAYIATGSGAPYSFPVGAHMVTANYSGDNSFNSSSSAPVSFTVGKNSPLVIVGVNQSSVTTTQPIGAHAVVTGFGTALATGSLQFTVDGQPYGAVIPLQVGGLFGTQAQASALITGLAAGNHKIGANYDGSGDTNFSSVVNTDSAHEPNNPTVTVTAAGPGTATTTTLTASPAPMNLGDTGKFTVMVSPTAATGTVTLWDAVGARSSPTTITGGSATIQFPWTQGGTTSLYAVYSGDTARASSSSASVTFTVKPGIPAVVLTAPAQSLPTQQVSLDATLTGLSSAGTPAGSALPYPTGIVEFWDSLNGGPLQLLSAQNLTAGGGSTAVYAIRSKLTAGTHTLKAHYRGDNNWQATDSASVTVLSAAVSDFTLGLSPSSMAFPAGSSASATATVTPTGGFTGNVALSCPTGSAFPIAGYSCAFVPSSTVAMNGTTVETATLNLTPTNSLATEFYRPRTTFRSGPGLWPVALLAGLLLLAGATFESHARKPTRQMAWASGWVLCVASVVLGCGGGGGGGGGTVRVTSSTTISSTNPRAVYQTPVTFNIVVKANSTPSGTVQLTDNGQIYSSGTVSAGIATFETTTLPVGVHVLVAQYSGDANTLASSSTPITQIITGSVSLPVTATAASSTHTTTLTVAVN